MEESTSLPRRGDHSGVADHQQRVEALVNENLSLVKQIAAGIFRLRSFDGIPFEDYVQFGVEGLIQAARRYDPARGQRFKTYAAYRIRGAIQSGMESSSEVSRQLATLRQKRRERMESVAALAEPAQTSVSFDKAVERLMQVSSAMAISIMLEDTAMFRSEVEPHHWQDGASGMAFRQLQRRLAQLVDALSPPRDEIIRRHYFEDENFDNIALTLELSKGRVSQLHRQALGELKSRLADQHLNQFVG